MQLYDATEKQISDHCGWLREQAGRIPGPSELSENMVAAAMFLEIFVVPKVMPKKLLSLPSRPDVESDDRRREA